MNGTRGKSTVTRLIADVLNHTGVRTVAKLTGESPATVHPERGTEPLVRSGPARIQEQARFLNWAAGERAEAAVLECMALVPGYQLISEQLIRAHIGVITNARLDHLEVMGPDRAAVAHALLQMTPFGGTLILGDSRLLAEAEPVAAARATRIVLAEADAGAAGLEAAAAIASALVRELDWPAARIQLADAFLRLRSAAASEPAVEQVVSGLNVLPLWTANDVDSFDQIWKAVGGRSWLVFNHRADRPLRTRSFAALFGERQCRVGGLLLIGDRGAARAFRNNLAADTPVRQLPRAPSWAELADAAYSAGATAGDYLVGCGNWKGAPSAYD